MPTGYTAPVSAGEITEFSDFAMNCARAFGALISMRDEPSNAKIPDEFTVGTYHQTALEEAKTNLAAFEAMDADAIREEVDKRNAKAIESYQKELKSNADIRSRYEAMLSQAVAWNPPTPGHEELKNFMISQLQDSIKHDCGYTPEAPKMVTPTEWLNNRRKELSDSVDYHTKNYQEDFRCAAERTAWVRELRNSLA